MDRFADIILTPIALFTGKPLAVGLALGILGAALLLWLGVMRPAERRFVGKLQRIAAALRGLRQTEGSQERHFAEADRIFGASDLALAWRRYRSSVEFEDGAATSYADPGDFFSLAYLPGHGYPKWSATLAGVFLTVGLFFTFVGLSAALLKLAGDGHDSLSPAQLKIAVEGILAVSSVKFITSIAGILSYIFWSVVARQQSATQAHAEDVLLEEMRGLSTYVAPEMLLRRQLRLAEALPQALAANIGASVAEALSPVRDELAAMSARIGQTQENVGESAGAAFGSLMQDGIGRHLDSFGDRLGGALAALDALPEKFREAEAGFGSQIGRGAQEMTASVARMVAAIEKSQSGLAATLASFDRKLAAIPATVATTAEQSAQDMSASLRKTLDGVAESAAQVNRVGAENLFARVDEMSGALASVAALLTQAGQTSGAQMAQGAEKFTVSAESTAARLSQTIDGFTLAVNRLTTRLDHTETTLDAQNQRLSQAGEIVTGASNTLAQAAGGVETAAGGMATAAGAMESAAAPMTTATSLFRDAMTRFAEATDRIGVISASGDTIAGHIAAFGTQMTHSLAAFDALPEKLREAEAGFGGQIGRGAEEMTASVARMIAAIEQGQTGLAATLASFDRKIAAIPAAVATTAQQSAQDMDAAMRKTLDGVAESAAQAQQAGAQTLFARVDEMSGALASVAALLTQAGQTSGAQMAEGAEKFTASAETTAARLSQTIDGFTLAVNRLTTRLDHTETTLDAQNSRLSQAGEIVAGASNNLAKAAGAMENAAAPMTSATLSFRDAMIRFADATDRIGVISASGDAIAGHIASFGTQMTESLAAFDTLPEKIRATESGFGGEITRTASELTQAALRMSAGFERGQSALAMTLSAFESKIEAIPGALAAASENTSQDIGARIRQTLDDAASVAARATSGGADILATRIDEISRALTTAADRLLLASASSGDQLRASQGSLASGMAEGVKIVSDTAENSAALLSRTVETFASAVRGLSGKLGDVSAGLDAHNVRLEKAGVIVSGASTSLAEAAGSVTSAATPLTHASVLLHGAMDKFAGTADQIRVMAESGQQVVENFQRTATEAHKTLGSQAESFRSVEREVGHTLGELVRGVQNLGLEISQAIETYDNEIAKSIGSLEAAMIDIGDIVDTRSSRRAEAR